MSESRRRKTAVVGVATSATLLAWAVVACSSFSSADPDGTTDAAPEGAAPDGLGTEDPDAHPVGDAASATDALSDDGGLFAVCSSSTVLLTDTFRRGMPDDFINAAATNASMQWSAIDAPDSAGPTFTLLPAPGGGDAGFKDLEISVPAGAAAAQFLHKDGTDGHRAYCVTLHAQMSAGPASSTSRVDLLELRLASPDGAARLISFGLQGASPQLALRTMVVNMPSTNEAALTPFDNPGQIHDFFLVVDVARQIGALYIDPPEAGVPTPTLQVPYHGGDPSAYVLGLGASPTAGGSGGVGATTLAAAGLRFYAQ